MKKWIVIFLVAVVLFIFGCEDKQAKEKIDSVNAELAVVQGQLEEITSERDDLKINFTKLQDEMTAITEIAEKAKTAEQLKSDLETKVASLVKEKDELTSKIKGFMEQIEQLKNANSRLQQMVDKLKGGAEETIEKLEAPQIPSISK